MCVYLINYTHLNMKFYKGVLVSDLIANYIPGTVTNNFHTALMWKEIIQSKKRRGAARHVNHGQSCIIEIIYNAELKSHDEFQRTGVTEHKRENCWLSFAKDKAQLNTVCAYRILSDKEINELY